MDFTESPGACFSNVRNFTYHFRVSQFPLYLKNREDLSRQTSQSLFFLLPWKHVKRSAFQIKRLALSQMASRAPKIFGLSRNGPQAREGGGGVLPYMGYIGMCRCEGYGFQAVYSSIGYIYQSVWVQNRVSFFTKLTSWLKILSRLRKPGIATQNIKKWNRQV